MDIWSQTVDKSRLPVEEASASVGHSAASDAGNLTLRTTLGTPVLHYTAADPSAVLREASRPYTGQDGSMTEDELWRAHGLDPS